MKYRSLVLRVGIVLCMCMMPVPAFAIEPSVTIPALSIREIKITGDELVVLQANENISDLSEYWIGYASSETAAIGSIVPVQQLPAKSLAAGQAMLMTSDGGATCDAVLTTKLSVALADTKGTLVVRRLQSNGLSSTFTTVDSVNWLKPSASATTNVQLDLRKETASLNYAVWYHDPSFTKSWRVGNLSGCTLTLAAQSTTSNPDVVVWVQASVEPPAIIENINEVETNSGESDTPSDNSGLAVPIITELLANPSGTGNDATDEFIELYNSNDRAFDLSGFILQTGLSTLHTYTIPNGTSIAPKSFRVFFSQETGLSMSNTSGQATLLDTTKTIAHQSDPYDSAPDGQAWALANGVWYWTTKPTPAATNIIAQPIASAATAVKKLTVNASAKAGSVKGATTTAKKATAKKTATSSTKNTATSQPSKAASVTPIHTGVLAAVALGAIGYGVYAYRHDFANAVHKLRANRIFRRFHR